MAVFICNVALDCPIYKELLELSVSFCKDKRNT